MSVHLVMLSILFLAAPLSTVLIWRTVYWREQNQIQLDNEAILLGRKLREVLEVQHRWEKAIHRLEEEHHYLQKCGPSCGASDAVLQIQLDATSRIAELELHSLWSQVLLQLSDRVSGLSADFPWQRPTCRICGGSWKWSARPRALPFSAKLSLGKHLAPVFLCAPSMTPAQYWLFASETKWKAFCHP